MARRAGLRGWFRACRGANRLPGWGGGASIEPEAGGNFPENNRFRDCSRLQSAENSLWRGAGQEPFSGKSLRMVCPVTSNRREGLGPGWHKPLNTNGSRNFEGLSVEPPSAQTAIPMVCKSLDLCSRLSEAVASNRVTVFMPV